MKLTRFVSDPEDFTTTFAATFDRRNLDEIVAAALPKDGYVSRACDFASCPAHPH
jgi:hypothetical protein